MQQEDVQQQLELLQTYRASLSYYLRQIALTGSLNTPPSVLHGIKEARQNISRIKTILQGWGVQVDHHPDDDAPKDTPTSLSDISQKTPTIRSVGSGIEKNIKRLVKEFTCGFCYSQTGYDIIFADYSVLRSYYGDILNGIAVAILRCRQCQMYNSLNFTVVEEDHISARDQEELEELLANKPNIISASINPDWMTIINLSGQFPFGRNFPNDIPEDIIRIIREAGDCLAVGALNAAVVMCRRAVEKLAVNSGINVKVMQLTKILGQLKANGDIDEALYEALTEIRYWGNRSAHALHEDEGLEIEQAREMFDLVVHAVEYAFSKRRLENRTMKLRQRRIPKTSE